MLVGTGAQLRKIDETQSVKVADVALPTVNQLSWCHCVQSVDIKGAREGSCEKVQLPHLVLPAHTTSVDSGHCPHSCEKHCHVEA